VTAPHTVSEPNPVRYEVDHAGRADWRVLAVSTDERGVERREWCQTYASKTEADASAKILNARVTP
jgi:hypothetical protein